jgi:RNA 3'-phosphate cyclase
VVLQANTHQVSPVLDIDGSYGEGGGQLLRTAVSLAAATGKAIRVHSVRAKRKPSGLAPQHLAAIRAARELCRGHLEGAVLRSQEIAFFPNQMEGGAYTFDIGTAGSITLLLQALLPMMVSARKDFSVRVTGGTDVRGAPPFDYFRNVFIPLVSSLGVNATATLQRRGYYPRGGGIVEIAISPGGLQPSAIGAPGRLLEVGGIAHVAHLPLHIAERMRASALASLAGLYAPDHCTARAVQEESAIGSGGAIALWARHEYSVLGAGCVAERGIPAERLGGDSGAALRAELMAHTALDVHAADQILVYLAFALTNGPSHFTVREVTSHTQTAMWLIEQLLPARFSVEPHDGQVRIRVSHGSVRR